MEPSSRDDPTTKASIRPRARGSGKNGRPDQVLFMHISRHRGNRLGGEERSKYSRCSLPRERRFGVDVESPYRCGDGDRAAGGVAAGLGGQDCGGRPPHNNATLSRAALADPRAIGSGLSKSRNSARNCGLTSKRSRSTSSVMSSRTGAVALVMYSAQAPAPYTSHARGSIGARGSLARRSGG